MDPNIFEINCLKWIEDPGNKLLFNSNEKINSYMLFCKGVTLGPKTYHKNT